MMFERAAWLRVLASGPRPAMPVVEAARTLRSMYNGVQFPLSQLEALATAAADYAVLAYDGEAPVRRWAPTMPFQFVAAYLRAPPGPNRTGAEDWTKLRSTDPLERVNKAIGRLTAVAGIFANTPPRCGSSARC